MYLVTFVALILVVSVTSRSREEHEGARVVLEREYFVVNERENKSLKFDNINTIIGDEVK
jgi:hypothetical protein